MTLSLIELKLNYEDQGAPLSQQGCMPTSSYCCRYNILKLMILYSASPDSSMPHSQKTLQICSWDTLWDSGIIAKFFRIFAKNEFF